MKTTKRDFRVFVAECERLRKAWRLDGYVLRYKHCLLDTGQANCDQSYKQRGAVLALNTEWILEDELPKSDDSVREMARHEMVHALTGQFGIVAYLRFATEEQIDSAEHELVVRLMDLLP